MNEIAMPTNEAAAHLVAETEWDSKQLLVGLPLVPERRCHSAQDVTDALAQLAPPYVLKASGVAHKSELGLVRVGLDADAVAASWSELAEAGDGSVLVAEMVSADLELVVGGFRDPHFGPVVTVGFGGVAAEIFRDAITMLAPTEPGEVEASLDLLKGAALLRGYRGSAPVDVTGIEQVVNAVATLMVRDETVAEIDCNPVMITNGQPVVVDALVVRDSTV